MLVCFGLAWPLNIIKSLRTKSTKGKRVFFLIVILVGNRVHDRIGLRDGVDELRPLRQVRRGIPHEAIFARREYEW